MRQEQGPSPITEAETNRMQRVATADVPQLTLPHYGDIPLLSASLRLGDIVQVVPFDQDASARNQAYLTHTTHFPLPGEETEEPKASSAPILPVLHPQALGLHDAVIQKTVHFPIHTPHPPVTIESMRVVEVVAEPTPPPSPLVTKGDSLAQTAATPAEPRGESVIGISNDLLMHAAATTDKETFLEQLAKAEHLARMSAGEGVVTATAEQNTIFTYKNEAKISAALHNRTITWAQMVRKIEDWQRALDAGRTVEADGINITQAVLEKLKKQAAETYEMEIYPSAEARALAAEKRQEDLPEVDEILDAIDYGLHPSRREALLALQETAARQALESVLQAQRQRQKEYEEKEARRLPNRIRAWIEKGKQLVGLPKKSNGNAQAASENVQPEAIVTPPSLDEPSETASAYFAEMIGKNL